MPGHNDEIDVACFLSEKNTLYDCASPWALLAPEEVKLVRSASDPNLRSKLILEDDVNMPCLALTHHERMECDGSNEETSSLASQSFIDGTSSGSTCSFFDGDMMDGTFSDSTCASDTWGAYDDIDVSCFLSQKNTLYDCASPWALLTPEEAKLVRSASDTGINSKNFSPETTELPFLAQRRKTMHLPPQSFRDSIASGSTCTFRCGEKSKTTHLPPQSFSDGTDSGSTCTSRCGDDRASISSSSSTCDFDGGMISSDISLPTEVGPKRKARSVVLKLAKKFGNPENWCSGLPSVGTAAHPGNCRPCRAFCQGRCVKRTCKFCHHSDHIDCTHFSCR